MHRSLFILALASVATGCTFDEGLEIHDLQGKVILPADAASRTTANDTLIEDDPRLIGPVYLGLYSEIVNGQTYPTPAVGPAIGQSAGDTFPYGGTTVGDLRFACIEDLQCRVVGGRYVDFDGLVSWFNDDLGIQLNDAFGDEITTGDYLRQICFDLFHYTNDEEIRVTATEDRNDDDKLDELDLDFIQRNDGKWEADFTILQADYFDGFSLWGWMDAPSYGDHLFSTCDPTAGFDVDEYSTNYSGGRPYLDLLNTPSTYVGVGDWVPSADPASNAYIWDSPDEIIEIELDKLVGEQ